MAVHAFVHTKTMPSYTMTSVVALSFVLGALFTCVLQAAVLSVGNEFYLRRPWKDVVEAFQPQTHTVLWRQGVPLVRSLAATAAANFDLDKLGTVVALVFYACACWYFFGRPKSEPEPEPEPELEARAQALEAEINRLRASEQDAIQKHASTFNEKRDLEDALRDQKEQFYSLQEEHRYLREERRRLND